MSDSFSGVVAIIFVISLLVGVYRCSKYFLDDEYANDQVAQVERLMETQSDKYKSVFTYFGYATLIFAGSCALLILLFARWRGIKVFVSYNLENENIAEEVTQLLNKSPVKAQYFPFSKLNRDEIIQKIQKMIRWADAAIIIPGNREGNNFTDAEIMAASTLKKPVIFLDIDDDQLLPNTAFSGYPHFRWDLLDYKSFNPIRYFLLVIFRHTHSLRSIFSRAMNGLFTGVLFLWGY